MTFCHFDKDHTIGTSIKSTVACFNTSMAMLSVSQKPAPSRLERTVLATSTSPSITTGKRRSSCHAVCIPSPVPHPTYPSRTRHPVDGSRGGAVRRNHHSQLILLQNRADIIALIMRCCILLTREHPDLEEIQLLFTAIVELAMEIPEPDSLITWISPE